VSHRRGEAVEAERQTRRRISFPPVNFLAKLLLGDGTLKPELRAALEAEGLVLIEEGLPGSLRYKRFRAPGRLHHGKVTPERIGLGISEKRFVMYCRSGRVELVDSPYTSPLLRAVEISLQGDDKVAIRVDYDRAGVPKVTGEITISARTPNAREIVEQLNARVDPRDDPAAEDQRGDRPR